MKQEALHFFPANHQTTLNEQSCDETLSRVTLLHLSSVLHSLLKIQSPLVTEHPTSENAMQTHLLKSYLLPPPLIHARASFSSGLTLLPDYQRS